MGFAILHGPVNRELRRRNELTPDLKHIMSAERLPFSLAYFGSLAFTLFFAIGIRSTIGTLVAAIVQVRAHHRYELTPGRRPSHISRRILPRRRHDAALRRADGAARSIECPSVLELCMYLSRHTFRHNIVHERCQQNTSVRVEVITVFRDSNRSVSSITNTNQCPPLLQGRTSPPSPQS